MPRDRPLSFEEMFVVWARFVAEPRLTLRETAERSGLSYDQVRGREYTAKNKLVQNMISSTAAARRKKTGF